MGWFKNTEHHTVTANIFVPAWGWVGSDVQLELIRQNIGFSSQSGDGLVRVCSYHSLLFEFIFVPEWGWVGSYMFGSDEPFQNIFVPEWGWVGLTIIVEEEKLTVVLKEMIGIEAEFPAVEVIVEAHHP